MDCTRSADPPTSQRQHCFQTPPRRSARSLHHDSTWTASRCHRLLRPLQARIVALRKLASPEGTSTSTSPRTSTSSISPSASSSVSSSSVKKRSRTLPNPERQRKSLRRTYSQRSAKSEAPGELSSQDQEGTYRRRSGLSNKLPVSSTPLPRKTHGRESRPLTCYEDPPDPVETQNRLIELQRRTALGRCLACLRARQDLSRTTRLQHYERILRDLDAILQSTSASLHPPNSKSLLSMCLRKVPERVAGFEAEEEAGAREEGLLSSFRPQNAWMRIYDELEQLGSQGNGWDHLRTFVCSHALWIIKSAVLEGLMDCTFAGILVQYYRLAGCHSDATSLLEATLSQCKSNPCGHCESEGGTGSLQVPPLQGLSEQQSVPIELFQSLSGLAKASSLPAEWLLMAASGRVWTCALEALLSPNDSAGVLDFASASIATLCLSSTDKGLGERGRAVNSLATTNTSPLSIVGAIAAVAIMASHETREAAAAVKTRKRVSFILRTAQHEMTKGGGSTGACYMLRLAEFVVSFGEVDLRGEDRAAFLKAAWQRDTARNHARSEEQPQQLQLYDLTVALGCSIAHCCGRATSTPSSDYFTDFCDRVASLKIAALQSLRKDGAFSLAQKTHDLRDLVFAETLGVPTTTPYKEAPPTATPESKGRSSSSSAYVGYRWEEGISEWVIATPTSTATKKTAEQGAVGGERFQNGYATKVLDNATSPGSDGQDGPFYAQPGQRELKGREERRGARVNENDNNHDNEHEKRNENDKTSTATTIAITSISGAQVGRRGGAFKVPPKRPGRASLDGQGTKQQLWGGRAAMRVPGPRKPLGSIHGTLMNRLAPGVVASEDTDAAMMYEEDDELGM